MVACTNSDVAAPRTMTRTSSSNGESSQRSRWAWRRRVSLMKAGVQIGFGVFVVSATNVLQSGIAVFAPHVRRVRNHGVVLPCQQPSLLKQWLEDMGRGVRQSRRASARRRAASRSPAASPPASAEPGSASRTSWRSRTTPAGRRCRPARHGPSSASAFWLNSRISPPRSPRTDTRSAASLLEDRRVEGVGDVGGVHPLALLKRQDVRLRLAVEDAAVVGTGLHHQGEGRKLGRPVVDLQAEQVLLQDQRGMSLAR